MGRSDRGLTLLEMLVVLVLVTLLATLLVQGLGFFLGKYDAVRRVQSRLADASVRQHWFEGTVRGMVPLLSRDRAFRGDTLGFEGTTLEPLAADSGMPLVVGWSIRNDEGGFGVYYREGGEVDWRVMADSSEALAFQYADRGGNWHDAWPVEGMGGLIRLPSMVRLIKSSGEVVWVARLGLHPEPVRDFQDMS